MGQKTHTDVRAVANFILDHADGIETAVTNRAVSELTYLLLGWHLAAKGEALASATIEASPKGPAIRELYAEFEKWGDGPILRKASKVDPGSGRRSVVAADFDLKTEEFLTRCADEAVRMPSDERRSLVTDPQGPWAAAIARAEETGRGRQIPEGDLRDYFSAQLAPRGQAACQVA